MERERPLHPLPRGLVELYGLLAVLIVLVPEWLAGGALDLQDGEEGDLLPSPAAAWRRVPELLLASQSVRELRSTARRCGLRGYGRLGRGPLTALLLRRLRRQAPTGL